MANTRILIIDDDEHLSRTIASLLQLRDYVTDIVNDPRDACARAIAFRPDLILLDVIMPYMDGGTVAMHIREVASLRDTPVIFLTSILDESEAAARGNTLGNDPVLPKPVTSERLLSEIDKVLAGHRPGAEGSTP